MTKSTLGQIHADAATAIREELGKQFPDIDALNKEYSFWKNADTLIAATITRRTGQVKPLGQKLMGAAGTAAGYAAGGFGGAVLGREAMQAVEKAITSTAWNTVSAGMKSRLADAIAGGDTSTIMNFVKAIAKGTA